MLMATNETGSARIHCEFSGANRAPAILLLNSLGSDLRMWNKLVPYLDSSFRVLRCDARGHGKSQLPPGPCALQQLGRDALSVLDRAGVGRAHICGLSLGGLIAMWIALHAPERAGRIVLANTAARIGNSALWDERIAAVRNAGMKSLAQATLGRWFTPAYREQHPEEMEDVRRMIAATSPEGYIACCRILRDTDLRDEVSAIETPCLVIVGAHDPATPPGDGRSLNAALRNSRCVELDASHLSAWEQAQDFSQATLGFLAEEELAYG
jgi:3-oxoadipate enol-lactonase